MARFMVNIAGSRGAASRLGSADSGISAHARGWNVGVRVEGFADGEADEFHVFVTGGSHGREAERMVAVVRREPGGAIEVEPRIVPAREEV